MIERVPRQVEACEGPADGPYAQVDAQKASMRRFADRYATLPVDFQATCPTCRKN